MNPIAQAEAQARAQQQAALQAQTNAAIQQQQALALLRALMDSHAAEVIRELCRLAG